MMQVMVDLETMGKRAGCAIVSIGAVLFDPQKGELYGNEFYTNVDLVSCTQAGLMLDAETVLWWIAQNEAARAKLLESPKPLRHALLAFTEFLALTPQEPVIWAHGATFDPPILEAAFVAADVKVPWKYSAVRDTRTIYELANYYPDRAQGTHHNALDDARNQALAVIEAHKRLIG